MQVWIDRLFHLLEAVLVFLLSAMVVMVFGNVVLRYGFNKGINVSEELSRYFFVWLTFIGAVVTFRENAHLGVESVVRLLPRRGRIVCMLITNSIILLCAGIFFWGTWLQHDINASMVAPVVGISMAALMSCCSQVPQRKRTRRCSRQLSVSPWSRSSVLATLPRSVSG